MKPLFAAVSLKNNLSIGGAIKVVKMTVSGSCTLEQQAIVDVSAAEIAVLIEARLRKSFDNTNKSEQRHCMMV